MNEFKAKVYQTAIDQLKQKETLLAEERKNIIESILEEEKNSAGDKYETSRETMTQDLNSLEKQIKQSKLDLEELYRLNTHHRPIVNKYREGKAKRTPGGE